MAIELTEQDYRRLTGRLYALHERRPGQPTDASDGGRTGSRDAEPDGADDEPDDAEETPPEDGEEEPAEEPADGAPAAAPVGPKPDDDDGAEKPLPPNKDGIFGGKSRRSLPTTVMGASKQLPRSFLKKQVRG